MLWTTLTSTTLWDLVGLETVWQILDQAHARLIGDKLDVAFEKLDSADDTMDFLSPRAKFDLQAAGKRAVISDWMMA